MILLFIIFLDACVPLSMDLYLPALPSIAAHLHASMGEINWTLASFFVFYALGMLIWGPLSDKYGRRPIIRTGLLIYFIGSLFCAFSGSLSHFIFFRIVQGFGGGAASAVSIAMVKDLYSGRKRETVIAVVQSLVIIIPIIAPSVGAFLLQFTSWRGAFYALTAFGLIGGVGSLFIPETLQSPNLGSVRSALGRPLVVLKNRRFTALLLIFSLPAIPAMAYIAASSFVYIQGFGLSEQQYALFFSFNALVAMAGPSLYILFSRYIERNLLLTFAFPILVLGGCLIALWGGKGPWFFALFVVPCTLAGSFLRAPSTHLMLEQQDGDTGSAASLIACVGLLCGALGMMLISQNWGNTILAYGIMSVLMGAISGGAWFFLSRRQFFKSV